MSFQPDCLSLSLCLFLLCAGDHVWALTFFFPLHPQSLVVELLCVAYTFRVYCTSINTVNTLSFTYIAFWSPCSHRCALNEKPIITMIGERGRMAVLIKSVPLFRSFSTCPFSMMKTSPLSSTLRVWCASLLSLRFISLCVYSIRSARSSSTTTNLFVFPFFLSFLFLMEKKKPLFSFAFVLPFAFGCWMADKWKRWQIDDCSRHRTHCQQRAMKETQAFNTGIESRTKFVRCQ